MPDTPDQARPPASTPEETTPERDTAFVPEQVRRAGQRADELQRQILEEGEKTPNQGGDQGENEAPAEPATGSAPTAGSAPPPPTGEWEQRYRTLQGKYDAETNAMRGQLASMERVLASVQNTPQQPPQSAPVPVQYNESDLELYGSELLDAAARAADARSAGRIAQLQAKIEQLEGSQANLNGAAHQDRVFRALSADPELAGRWDRINNDPAFVEWLQGIDEFSGLARNVMLQHAYNSGDAIRTGRFFKRYMADHGHTEPPSLPAASQTGASAQSYYRSSNGNGYAPAGGPRLEDMAAPGRAAGSGAGNGAPQRRIWSRSDIKAFYRDRTNGKFRGREAEAHRLEEDLFLAETEGRLA